MQSTVRRTDEPIRHEVENGAAALAFAYKADALRPFVFSADLSLPLISNNKGWYAVWLMVAQAKDTAHLPSMLQIGLIRWHQSHWNLQPFLCIEHSGQPIQFIPVRTDITGIHNVAIEYDAERVKLLMDRQVLMDVKRDDFFKGRDDPIYLKIAAEVFADGDRVSGIANDVVLQTGGKTISPMPYAGIEDRGLRFHCDVNKTWTAVGIFDPSLPLEFYRPGCPTPEKAS